MATPAPTLEFTGQFLDDVVQGLSKTEQKVLPSKYLYDAVGSRLFDAITELPEYGLTRAETRILSRYAAEMTAQLGERPMIAELGSGSGQKTRYILEALRRPAAYYPIEISRTALAHCERELSDIDSIGIVGLERDYLDGLSEVTRLRCPGQQVMVLFLGSTIGNFEERASICFLKEIRRMLTAGDALLLGADLLKPLPTLIAAYDDPLGVTAAFNLNLLARINRELGGTFVLSQFAHAARFNENTRSIEMHLQSKRGQTVEISGYKCRFLEGETVWTESCHKFSRDEPAQIASESGFRLESQWIDKEWGFTENLFIVE